jgi:hypothetical protein
MKSNGPVARRAGDQGTFQRIVMHVFALHPALRLRARYHTQADEGSGRPIPPSKTETTGRTAIPGTRLTWLCP